MADLFSGILFALAVVCALAGWGGFVRTLLRRVGFGGATAPPGAPPGRRHTQLWISMLLGATLVQFPLLVTALTFSKGLAYPIAVRGIIGLGLLLGGLLLAFHRFRRGATAADPATHPATDAAAAGAPHHQSPIARILPLVSRLLLGLAVIAVLVPAIAPPLAYDVLEYHLSAARLFARGDSAGAQPTNFYTQQPVAASLFYSFAEIAEGRIKEIAGKSLGAAWLLVFAAGCAAVARRLGARRFGAGLAALLSLSTGVALKVSLDAFSDAAAAAFAMLAVWGILGVTARRWGADPEQHTHTAAAPPRRAQASRLARRRFDALATGIGCGMAIACKWPSLTSTVVPLLAAGGLALLATPGERARLTRAAALIALVAALVFSPWAARSAITTGNPAFPWAASIFETATWSTDQERFLVKSHQPSGPSEAAWWKKVAQGIGMLAPGRIGGLPAAGYLLPALALVAFATVAARDRRLALLAVCGAGGLAAWAAVLQSPDRFLLGVCGIFAAAAGALAEGAVRRPPHAPPATLAFHRPVAIALAATTLLCAADQLSRQFRILRDAGYFHALGNPEAAEDLRTAALGPPMRELFDALATAVDRRNKQLSTGDAPAYRSTTLLLYEARGYLAPLPQRLNSVFDRSAFLELIRGADSPDAINRRLARAGVDFVVVNEFELDRLVRFYPPLVPTAPALARIPGAAAGAVTTRDLPPFTSKPPGEPHPWLAYYAPHRLAPNFDARLPVLEQWHREAYRRAFHKYSSARGLSMYVLEVPAADSR